ncbi:MAG: hypothetical protein JW741_30525 [Sedimentisphaerales bacterium]|nr:hypothetical protein [Sedimentisphaerales bacterium]
MPTMTDNAVLVQFANACKAAVHSQWSTFASGQQRANKLFDITCLVLDICQVPRPSLQLDANLGGASGLFDFSHWKLKIDPNGFGQNATPDRDAFLTLVTLIYHEARHCEQWFQMARYAAVGHQMTAQKLSSSLFIPVHIASTALNRKMGLSDPMLALTKEWYESVYGAKSGFRGITLQGLMLRRTGDAKLNNFHNGFHSRYSGVLPEEIDAWAVQEKVADHYKYP